MNKFYEYKLIYLDDGYSAESNCSSVTHSRDQSPCTQIFNNQECSNAQKVIIPKVFY